LNNTFKFLTTAACLALPTQAFALFCSNCATNIQAAASYVKEVEGVVHQVTSLQHQVESIGYQVENLKTIGKHDWGNAIRQIKADINDEWHRRFQGYEGWAQNGTSPVQVSEQYRLWGDTMRDTAKSALQVAAEMAKVQQEDERTLETLQGHSSSATGALQAAQAGNELVAQTTRQMQKIQTLLQTDLQMTATTMATASEKEEQKRAADDSVISGPRENKQDGMDWSKPWNETPHQW